MNFDLANDRTPIAVTPLTLAHDVRYAVIPAAHWRPGMRRSRCFGRGHGGDLPNLVHTALACVQRRTVDWFRVCPYSGTKPTLTVLDDVRVVIVVPIEDLAEPRKVPRESSTPAGRSDGELLMARRADELARREWGVPSSTDGRLPPLTPAERERLSVIWTQQVKDPVRLAQARERIAAEDRERQKAAALPCQGTFPCDLE